MSRSRDGSTALHWAVYQDDKEAVNLLISRWARVNAVNEFGATPLWVACTEGRAAMMDVLLRGLGHEPRPSHRRNTFDDRVANREPPGREAFCWLMERT